MRPSIFVCLFLTSGFIHASTIDERLIEAATHGDVEQIASLLAGGANVNFQTVHGSTPLFAATNMNRTAAVRLLLERGANPNLDAKANSPLTIAVGRDTEIVGLLLKAGANPNFQMSPYRTTPIGFAAILKRETFEILKNRGRYNGPFPNMERTVTLLIEAGADVNHEDSAGKTPLRAAVLANNIEIVRLLLRAGADVNARNRTPQLRTRTGADDPIVFDSAAGYPLIALEITELLLNAGADPNYRNFRRYDADFDSIGQTTDGYTALTFSARWGQLPVVELLLKHGADPCLSREDGAQAIAIADKHRHKLVAMKIREQGDRKCSAP